jgi:hypothetical protein
MTLSRRRFLELGLGAAVATSAAGAQADPSHPRKYSAGALIDRKALVQRHNPLLRKLDPLAPLSIGNGEFAFTADITGLQTFPNEYEKSMPLCTMSQWGWHTKPLPNGLDPKALRLTQYDTHGRTVGYHTSSEGQTELFNWLRENPHRLNLARIGLWMHRSDVQAFPADIADVDQKLDLWSGILKSSFTLDGDPIFVRTAVHPVHDLLAVEITSPLVRRGRPGRLGVRLGFPYGSPEMNGSDWSSQNKHKSTVTRQRNSAQIHRQLDDDEYYIAIEWEDEASLDDGGHHQFILYPSGTQDRLAFVAFFSRKPTNGSLPSPTSTFAASSDHWQHFWNHGGAVDFSDSSERRAPELERRVVVSQYLTAIQCAGSMPPQETGLTCNSWYGKFHLEMHWWHAAHFALWDRVSLLEKSLGWYESILPSARELARSQGYRGARWPKMVGPEGRDSPSPVGPLLIWQQPHPISYAELCYRVHPNRATLARYGDIVFDSAEFMASYAYFESMKERYVLGPPLIPAQENHPARETWNPTFELKYWSFGLQTAQRWRERLRMKRSAEWDRVLRNLSALPTSDKLQFVASPSPRQAEAYRTGGVYLAHENCPQTFTERNYDHPSMLGALGMLPGDGVDREMMRRTLKKVMSDWQWDKTWGWDYPLTAMTAARLSEPKIALDALLMNTEKNRYLPNGHNWQRPNLPCYLPGNGGLLYAVAMMAGGWKGAPPRSAPGFPDDGDWKVRSENLRSHLLT